MRLLEAYAAFSQDIGAPVSYQRKNIEPEKSYKRKLCKSCADFPCYRNRWNKPTQQACEQYKPKHK